jgi:hypothetical protein
VESVPIINVFYRVLDPVAILYFEVESPILCNEERSRVLSKSFLYKNLTNIRALPQTELSLSKWKANVQKPSYLQRQMNLRHELGQI